MMTHIPNVEIKLPKKKNNTTTQRRVCVYTLRDIRFLFKLTVLPHSLALCCRIRLSTVTYEHARASERACGGIREKNTVVSIRVLTHIQYAVVFLISNRQRGQISSLQLSTRAYTHKPRAHVGTKRITPTHAHTQCQWRENREKKSRRIYKRLPTGG